MTFDPTRALSKFLALLVGAVPLSVMSAPYCDVMDVDNDPAVGVMKVSAGVVTAGTIEHLLIDPEIECPRESIPSAKCRQPVRGGLRGIELRRIPGWVCVALPGKQKLNVLVGWLRASRWQPIPDSAPASAHSWSGVWQNEGGRLNITVADKSRVHVDGHAILPKLFSRHFGDVKLDGFPNDDGVLRGNRGACMIALRRIGKYIFVQDGVCDGMDVRFSGLYRFRPDL